MPDAPSKLISDRTERDTSRLRVAPTLFAYGAAGLVTGAHDC